MSFLPQGAVGGQPRSASGGLRRSGAGGGTASLTGTQGYEEEEEELVFRLLFRVLYFRDFFFFAFSKVSNLAVCTAL